MIKNLKIMNQSQGQVIIILLLFMLLALSIGLAITQRSTSDLATSSQQEQSSRAYSAAEAGLEKALASPTATIDSSPIPLGNQTSAEVKNSGVLPIPGSQTAIEFPPIGKETFAQFWLTDPDNSSLNYKLKSFKIFFGNPGTYNSSDNIAPAVEVTVVVLNGGNYETLRYYIDSTTRTPVNNFNLATCTGVAPIATILNGAGSFYNTSKFYCSKTIDLTACTTAVDPSSKCVSSFGGNCTGAACTPQLVRVRLLYANVNQKIALQPTSGGSFPPQINVITSIGKAGQSQKTLQLFRVKDMIPFWMDFAIFSVNQITK